MAIFDIEKDELLRLSDTQLEELIARLCEAEIAVHGHSPAYVHWSGAITASDGGIDIHVQVPVERLSTGFIERPDTIFQARKHTMPEGKITKEMVPPKTGKLLPAIAEQAAKGGSYIIVSIKDDCSPRMQRDRRQAMQNAVADDPNHTNIYLDFYDRSKLAQWLRQHPSVMLWVKRKLGQGYSGWQPYGAWSKPPKGSLDTLISAPGVTVTLPSGNRQKLTIQDAIVPMRELIRTTNKAVRITGLSGVGKTRIVQALFDETVGTDALDRTIAVYVDTGENPDPSATAMFDRLIAEGKPAIMVLDNCPPELHSQLASKVVTNGSRVRLITVEYDIKEGDRSQSADVIHIEAVGPEVAEQLLLRRFPNIGRNNAQLIAKFADGNARVALAIAERVEEGESLAQLSDAQLFDRLFEQCKGPDDSLREQAEILSLVYSFSISTAQEGQNELEVLGSLAGYSEHQLHQLRRSVITTLSNRHIVQERDHWRAILPHAIANRLASSALDSIPVEQLRETFEAPGRQRLLMSFAHRLGLLHDHNVAKKIAESWLEPDGLLGRITALDDISARMLRYIAPVAPEALLDRLEALLMVLDVKGSESSDNPHTETIFNLLQLLAYEANAFERCIRLLIRVADDEPESDSNNSLRDQITRFFQAYLSGTHATLEQRVAIMNECFASNIVKRQTLGLKMLSTALEDRWTGFGVYEFGARPRDYGLHPSDNELVIWRRAFIGVAVQLGTSGHPDLGAPARQIMANTFRGMWHQVAMRETLVDAARKLHAHHPWDEGWKAVRSTIYLDHTKRKNANNVTPLPDNLAALEKELEPHDLIPAIQTYVLSKGHYYWAFATDVDDDEISKYARLSAKASQLGEEFATSVHQLDELGLNLFTNNGLPYLRPFGRGLAQGAHDVRLYWQQLVEQLERQPDANCSVELFVGFIEGVNAVDRDLAQTLLDQSAEHPVLRRALVGLHPLQEFTETDLDRCMTILDDPDIHPGMYRSILRRDGYAHLPKDRLLDLARRLLSKPSGGKVVLDALSIRLHDKDMMVDTLGSDFRQVGLRAAIQSLSSDHNHLSRQAEPYMEPFINAALRFEGNETEKQEWLDTIFAVVDRHYGHVHSCESAIETTAVLMPEAFLNRVFEGSEKQQKQRQFFIYRSGYRHSILASIDIEVLIAWCQTRDDAKVWPFIASVIALWEQDGEQDGLLITEAAIRFLEASPHPNTILEAFVERIPPSSYTGSRLSVMQPRADAIRALANHQRTDIVTAVHAVAEKMAQQIEDQKIREQREQREDRQREQRFE